jgi:hypothetical protein
VLAPALVTGPLRALVESGEVAEDGGGDGEGRVHSGPTTLGLLVDGALVEEPGRGLVELDGSDAPVRADYHPRP